VLAEMKIHWPFITRKEHEAIVTELRERLHDLERHFVIRRDEKGQVVETLADRQERKFKPKRVTWQQTRAYLELTDDNRRKMPSGKSA
jgi:hypothetical protein